MREAVDDGDSSELGDVLGRDDACGECRGGEYGDGFHGHVVSALLVGGIPRGFLPGQIPHHCHLCPPPITGESATPFLFFLFRLLITRD